MTNQPLPSKKVSEVVCLRRAIEEYLLHRPALVRSKLDRASMKEAVRVLAEDLEVKALCRRSQEERLAALQLEWSQRLTRLQEEFQDLLQVVAELSGAGLQPEEHADVALALFPCATSSAPQQNGELATHVAQSDTAAPGSVKPPARPAWLPEPVKKFEKLPWIVAASLRLLARVLGFEPQGAGYPSPSSVTDCKSKRATSSVSLRGQSKPGSPKSGRQPWHEWPLYMLPLVLLLTILMIVSVLLYQLLDNIHRSLRSLWSSASSPAAPGPRASCTSALLAAQFPSLAARQAEVLELPLDCLFVRLHKRLGDRYGFAQEPYHSEPMFREAFEKDGSSLAFKVTLPVLYRHFDYPASHGPCVDLLLSVMQARPDMHHIVLEGSGIRRIIDLLRHGTTKSKMCAALCLLQVFQNPQLGAILRGIPDDECQVLFSVSLPLLAKLVCTLGLSSTNQHLVMQVLLLQLFHASVGYSVAFAALNDEAPRLGHALTSLLCFPPNVRRDALQLLLLLSLHTNPETLKKQQPLVSFPQVDPSTTIQQLLAKLPQSAKKEQWLQCLREG